MNKILIIIIILFIGTTIGFFSLLSVSFLFDGKIISNEPNCYQNPAEICVMQVKNSSDEVFTVYYGGDYKYCSSSKKGEFWRGSIDDKIKHATVLGQKVRVFGKKIVNFNGDFHEIALCGLPFYFVRLSN